LEFKSADKETYILKINVEDKFEKVLGKLAYEKMTEVPHLKLIELYEHGNKLLQFKRMLNFENMVKVYI